MYPNPLIAKHAGIYMKEQPGDNSRAEVFELRPDSLIAWSVVEVKESGLQTSDNRGNWAISLTTLSLFLIDDDTEEMRHENYQWDGERWCLEADPGIYLRKRYGSESITDDLYFDHR